MNNIKRIAERDTLLKEAFKYLQNENLSGSQSWYTMPNPYKMLLADCQKLLGDTVFRNELILYLKKRPNLRTSVEMFFDYVIVAESKKSINAVDQHWWYLSRWLPTFLVIDAPIGRFFGVKDEKLLSPLKSRVSFYPALNSAKEFIELSSFKDFRNGLAHWNFEWEDQSPYIIIYGDNAQTKIKLHYKAVEAYHTIAISVIDILHTELINII